MSNARPDRLGAEDARILRLESPAIMGHTCKVVVVDPVSDGESLELGAIRRNVEARLGRAPRCRQRLAFTPLRLAEPAWVDDSRFDIKEHVRSTPIDGAVSRSGLREITARLMAQRLDHERPLWRMDLVGPLADGSTAIVWRIHHCMADGITALRLGDLILWDEQPDADPGGPSPWDPAPAPGALRLASLGLADRLNAAGRAAARAARWVASPGRWRESP